MAITLFTGCSYTFGAGWENETNDSRLWVNILHANNSFLKNTEKLNLGINGASNQEIFTVTVNALIEHHPEYAIVEWTSYPRYRVLLSVETYNSEQLFIPNTKCFDYKFPSISYTEHYLNNIRDRWLSLHHPHQEILNIVKYTNTLIKLANKIGTKIFFVNGICSWDNNYFDCLHNALPSNYTLYTQKILDCDQRDDKEIFILYQKIHNEYSNEGGIQHHLWLNLYDSMRSTRIDTNSDGQHPGIQSNINFSNIFDQQLTEKLSS